MEAIRDTLATVTCITYVELPGSCESDLEDAANIKSQRKDHQSWIIIGKISSYDKQHFDGQVEECQ